MPTRMRWILAAAIVTVALTWGGLILVTPRWMVGGGMAEATTAAVVYALADRVCHQRPERTFVVAGIQMPVCARCSGLYLAGALGALLAFGWTATARGRTPDDVARWRNALLASAVPTAVSWLLEVSGLVEPSMAVRAACALPLGAVTGWICVRAALGTLR